MDVAGVTLGRARQTSFLSSNDSFKTRMDPTLCASLRAVKLAILLKQWVISPTKHTVLASGAPSYVCFSFRATYLVVRIPHELWPSVVSYTINDPLFNGTAQFPTQSSISIETSSETVPLLADVQFL